VKDEDFRVLFDPEVMGNIFPPERADQFFEALFGDAAEGAYDIRLAFNRILNDRLQFQFELVRRPGKCLACNLTYGLPQVFTRHPIVNVKKIVSDIQGLLPYGMACREWQLGQTREISSDLHIMPFEIQIQAVT
jgi:hypothetical protein